MHRCGGRRAEEPDLALHRLQLSCEGEQRRRLAGAVGAQQRDDLARVDVEVEVADDAILPYPADRPARLDEGVGHGLTSSDGSTPPAGSTPAAPTVAISASAASTSSTWPRYASRTLGSTRTSLGGPLRDHATEVDDDDAVTRRHHEVHVVLDEQHAHVAFVGQPADEAAPARRSRSRRGRRPVRRASRSMVRMRPCARCRPAVAGRRGARRGSRRGRSRGRTRRTAATAAGGSSWRPGQNRSVTHDMVDARTSLPARMFSSTLTSSNSSSDWNDRRRPSRARFVAFSPSIDRPSSEIEPPLTGTKPVTASMSVVLPAPFGPIRPTTSPGLHLQRHVVDGDHGAEPHRQPADRQRRARHRLDLGGRERRPLLVPRGQADLLAERPSVGHDVRDAVLVQDQDDEHQDATRGSAPIRR